MKILFLDTSSFFVTVSILDNDKVLSIFQDEIKDDMSSRIMPIISECFDNVAFSIKDIDKIMVVDGPGSFTGVRIGVTIAKVYAYLVNCEIVSVSSLKMLALSSSNSDYYMALLDAKHDNYYMGIYDKDYNDIIEKFCSKDEVVKYIDKYNPVLVSNKDMDIDNNVVKRVELDLISIVNYYKDIKSENAHLVNPNYLKLPQVMEK